MDIIKFGGGVRITNKAGELIMWFKGKDPEPGEDGFSFGLFGFWPERAEESELPKFQEAIEVLKKNWRATGLPVFDINEIQTKTKKFVGSVRGHCVRGEGKVWVTDIVTRDKYAVNVHLENENVPRA